MNDTNTKLKNAFRAMEDLAFPADKVKPVLENLLKVSNNNWSYIEAEDYEVLVYAIFESEDEAAMEAWELEQQKSSSDIRYENGVEEEETEALVHPLKRSRLIYEAQSPTLQTGRNGETQALLGNTVTEDMLLLEAPLAILCPDFESTIASLNAKHGAIDKDCNLSSNWVKKLFLVGLCKLLKQLEKKRLDELDLSSLSTYYDFIHDMEKLNFNVKWLRERLDEIRVAVVGRDKVKRLEARKNVLLAERKQIEAELRWYQIQVKEMEDELTVSGVE